MFECSQQIPEVKAKEDVVVGIAMNVLATLEEYPILTRMSKETLVSIFGNRIHDAFKFNQVREESWAILNQHGTESDDAETFRQIFFFMDSRNFCGISVDSADASAPKAEKAKKAKLTEYSTKVMMFGYNHNNQCLDGLYAPPSGHQVYGVHCGFGWSAINLGPGGVTWWGGSFLVTRGMPRWERPVRRLWGGPNQLIALTEDGQLYSWGNNTVGVLGHPVAQSMIDQPTQIVEWEQALQEGIVDIKIGDAHAVVLTTKGVWGIGSNAVGQLGLGEGIPKVAQLTPLTVKEEIVGIWAAMDVTFLIKKEGGLLVTGRNLHDILSIATPKPLPLDQLDVPFSPVFQPVIGLVCNSICVCVCVCN
jgi:hypothetical protein